MRAGDLRERIELQRLNAATNAWGTEAIVWAAAEPQGDERYRFRVRYRPELRSLADIEPAMQILYRGRTLRLVDVVEVDPRVEVHLIAQGVVVQAPDLALGGPRTEAWP